MSTRSVSVVWTPADTQALRETAELYPQEVGQSEMLAYLVAREGIR